ncbi:hypothetical protein ACFTQ9_20950 [Bacillus velezensis]
MRLADVEKFVGVPYDADCFDCADLVVLVQLQLFGRLITLPGRRPRGAQGAAELGTLSRPYGVFFFLAHEGWVLHSNERNGCSVLHRVRELPGFGLRIEGFYSWV